ncbi:MAG TPA: hypothetical protein VD816_07600 [Ohtaekwangia sp.]|nr:hypothetical protein [Ohtaekwangia sp.]
MNTTFLDYYKMILDKVSFDPYLLNKEYKKAIRHLSTHEASDLNDWLKSRKLLPQRSYDHQYLHDYHGARQRH